jgi:type II secretory ATPase GspE/PulE/Tfp pilus assembly ATPase PilB-like protein
MTEELAKIEKPEAVKFESKRKLYLVPLLYSWEGAPKEYVEKFNLYWQQVREHIANLESKIGMVSRIYHESITIAGEEGIKVIEKINPASCQITKEKCQNGAQVEAAEDTELTEENMDWERHLLVGFISQKVAKTVSDFYIETSKKRYEHIARRIEETLKDKESAILFIREGHRIQFPSDIEVFSVSPPVLDEIHRWLRDRPISEGKDEAKTESE